MKKKKSLHLIDARELARRIVSGEACLRTVVQACLTESQIEQADLAAAFGYAGSSAVSKALRNPRIKPRLRARLAKRVGYREAAP